MVDLSHGAGLFPFLVLIPTAFYVIGELRRP
jgi:hypothetical protein